MNLRNKRILITAGPTWVAIDSMRIISNSATGTTGILLARDLARKGAKVTLVLGPVCGGSGYQLPNIRIVRFSFFHELKHALIQELRWQAYDVVIHSAAVSDFAPAHHIRGKLKSDRPHTLRLKVLPKLIATIQRVSPQSALVIFKLESGISDLELIRRARRALSDQGADIIVANKIKPKYRAYLLDKEKIYAKVDAKETLVKSLITLIGDIWN
ncbi:MAG: hypothetical protein A2Y00_06905 [Omnitrophica WOR_2 bacterium GWF2_43_52]|nr:MAG: hypothetical protein A2Y01_05310 [Omnitrophica WOR_2 bacterium GWC2_44_8]OGX20151.1 MAG: hypothetical protein A2Y00_06905 [Omnitrophica WOR_2 bacterium GWF2_43_52]HAH20958.1 hypothetical protein [Candidatus Omnitrophota bacterium]HBG63702.1 hypothetical protein [Candidatus Omnitrophota bacterium]HCD37226.1 hypothetical protein [Candidatus Omnitrophota bacterium]